MYETSFVVTLALSLATVWTETKAQQQDDNILEHMKVLHTGHSILNTTRSSNLDECTGHVNGLCGGAQMRCCEHLVCSPVWDDNMGKFLPRCVVPDASLIDPSMCYDKGESCYFHHQCCSKRCLQWSGEKQFICANAPTEPHMNPQSAPTQKGSSTTTLESTTTKKRHRKTTTKVMPTTTASDGGTLLEGEDKDNSEHIGNLNDKLPVATTIVLVLVALVFILLSVKALWYPKKEERFLGVDKIPDTPDTVLDTVDFEDNFNSNVKIDQVLAPQQVETPPALPPRDYGILDELDRALLPGARPLSKQQRRFFKR